MSEIICSFCGDRINEWDFDNLEAFEERSPSTFKKGFFHIECYKQDFAEAEFIESKNYSNKQDEYISRELSII